MRIFTFLNSNHENALQTELISRSLDQLNLLESWPLQVDIDGEAVNIQGLYRVNEAVLNDLPAEGLLNLRDNRALVVIYGQLMSMSHMKSLVELAQSAPHAVVQELDFDTLNEGGTISFDNF